jgi:hypothetical protein
VVAPQPRRARQSKSQRVTTPVKVSVRGSPRPKVVATGSTGLLRRVSASAPCSFDVDSDSTSLGVATLAACTLELGGEDGGPAVPEEFHSELESGPGSVTGAGAVEVSVVGTAAVEVAVPEGSVLGGPVALTSPVVSVAAGGAAHVPVVSATVLEEAVVVAEVSVASGAEAHPLVVSAAPVEAAVVVAEVSVASAAGADASLVPAVLEVSVVPEASAASAAGADASLVAAVLEVSVVPEASAASAAAADASLVAAVLEVSFVSEASAASAAAADASLLPAVLEVSFVPEASVASAAGAGVSLVPTVLELSAVGAGVSDGDDCAEASTTGGGGSSARAVEANRNAQRIAADTATVQARTLRHRCPKRRGHRPGTATELPSISASSPWLRALSTGSRYHTREQVRKVRCVGREAEKHDDPCRIAVRQP